MLSDPAAARLRRLTEAVRAWRRFVDFKCIGIVLDYTIGMSLADLAESYLNCAEKAQIIALGGRSCRNCYKFVTLMGNMPFINAF
jgi:hypothetical protein